VAGANKKLQPFLSNPVGWLCIVCLVNRTEFHTRAFVECTTILEATADGAHFNSRVYFHKSAISTTADLRSGGFNTKQPTNKTMKKNPINEILKDAAVCQVTAAEIVAEALNSLRAHPPKPTTTPQQRSALIKAAILNARTPILGAQDKKGDKAIAQEIVLADSLGWEEWSIRSFNSESQPGVRMVE
jgi:hypothetical protein